MAKRDIGYYSANRCRMRIVGVSDRPRPKVGAFPCTSGQSNYPVAAFLSLCLAASGIWSTLGPFWSLPTAFLGGTAAAGGVALINSIGNVGGFVGPSIIGYIKQTTESFTGGMLVLAGTLLIAGFLALRVKE